MPTGASPEQSQAHNAQESFLRLFLAGEGDLRAFIGSLLRDRHQREDVFQEVALVLWREFDRYDPARPFGAWARGIATRQILRRWRQDGRAPTSLSPEAVQTVCDAFDRREYQRLCGRAPAESLRAEALRKCLELLPEKSRRLLSLRYEQSLSLSKIAEALSAGTEAVQKALYRLRTRLLECVDTRLFHEHLLAERVVSAHHSGNITRAGHIASPQLSGLAAGKVRS